MKKEKLKRLAQTIIKHIIIKWTFDVIVTSVATVNLFYTIFYNCKFFRKLNNKVNYN